MEKDKNKQKKDVEHDAARMAKKKIMNKIKSAILSKLMVGFVFIFVKLLPIILIVSLIVVVFNWVIELFQGEDTAEIIYAQLLNSDLISSQEFSSLVEIKGDEENGYHLEFKEGFDAKCDKVVEELDKTPETVVSVDKDLLKQMIKAELVTQYPNLGGSVSGTDQFQGAVKIRRITPDKEYGEIKNTSSGETTKQNISFSGSESVVQPSEGEKIYKIGIMASHSTDDPGARSPTPKENEIQLKEEELTVKVAKYIEQAFSIYGNIEVVQIGSTEENPNVSNDGRLQKAKDEQVDVLIEIAFDSAGDGTKYKNDNGVSITYNQDGGSDETKKLGQKLKENVANSMDLNKSVSDSTETTNTLGTKDDSFLSLKINGGYLTSKKDYAIISQDLGLQLYAKGVINGILEYYGIENHGYGTMIDGEESISSTINSKVVDLKYVPSDQFEKDLSENPTQALQEYTLDDNFKVITATWSYADDTLSVTKNTSALDYRSIMSKYTMPMEYMLFWYIDTQSSEFAYNLGQLALDSEFIIMIEDNITTTKVETTTEESSQTKQQDDAGNYSIETEKEDLHETSKETKTTERVSPKIELIYADTWFMNFENKLVLENNKSNVKANGTVTENGAKSQSTDVTTEEWSETETVEEKEKDEDGNEITVEKEITKKYQKEITTQTTINSSTVSNQYKAGEAEVKGNEQKFVTLFKESSIKGMLIESWLRDLLENNPKTANMVDITDYLIYKATGNDTGVMSFDFSIYNPSNFNSMSTDTSMDLMIEYLHGWEGTTEISADGTKYKVQDDGAGNLTVGHGIDIVNGGYVEFFKEHGYTNIKLGDEIDKDLVDQLEKETIETAVESVKAETASLNLTDYQINALVSRYYNMGSSGWKCERDGKTFVQAYEAYWNKDTDDKYSLEDANTVDYNHNLYTKYMKYVDTANGKVLPGLTKRRQSEWRLFQTGYYDRIDKWHSDGTNGNIIDTADKIHQDQISWKYSIGADLYWGNIEMSINNPNDVTCCATYVSSVIYKAGYFDEASMNSFNYNSATAVYKFLSSAGWKVVSSYNELEAGDIVFTNYNNESQEYGHVQIYAGDDTWYNAGSTDAIQRSSPYSQGDWAKNNFSVALRPVT